MSFLVWLIGIWFTVLTVIFAVCAVGACVNFLRDRKRPPAATEDAKPYHEIVSVTLFYDPYSIELVPPSRFACCVRQPVVVGQSQVSSRLTSNPCGL